jgi:hypothetical protein
MGERWSVQALKRDLYWPVLYFFYLGSHRSLAWSWRTMLIWTALHPLSFWRDGQQARWRRRLPGETNGEFLYGAFSRKRSRSPLVGLLQTRALRAPSTWMLCWGFLQRARHRRRGGTFTPAPRPRPPCETWIVDSPLSTACEIPNFGEMAN